MVRPMVSPLKVQERKSSTRALSSRANAPIARTVLAGLVLTGVPLLALASHIKGAPTDHTLLLPATVTQSTLGPRLWLDISMLSTDELAGDDDFSIGDVAYVHNAVDGEALLYPYAISQNRAKITKGTVSLRAIVTAVNDDVLMLDFQFEDLAARSHIVRIGDDAQAEVSVNKRAVARLKAITIDGERTPYDLMEKPVLFGRTINGASIAPAAYPAK